MTVFENCVLNLGRRRSSLQKLHALQLEAPITKVITLLSNAITETTSAETAAQIDKVIFSYLFKKTNLTFKRTFRFIYQFEINLYLIFPTNTFKDIRILLNIILYTFLKFSTIFATSNFNYPLRRKP